MATDLDPSDSLYKLKVAEITGDGKYMQGKLPVPEDAKEKGLENDSDSSQSSDNEEDVKKETNPVVAAFRPPPPETSETIRTRLWVILSFWLIAMCLGLPLWHVTTTIYRAPLPMAEMQNWSEGKVCKSEFPLLVEVEAPSLPDAEGLLKTVQHALDDANDFAAHQPHHLRLRLSTVKQNTEKVGTDKNVACLLRLIPDSRNGFSHTVQPSSRIVDIHYPLPSSSSQSSLSAGLAKFVAETLEVIFWQEQEVIEHLLLPMSTSPSGLPNPHQSTADDSGSKKPIAPRHRPQNTSDITRRMSRVVKYSSSYHLTFSLFTATSLPATWDIESAISAYLAPLLSALSPISNFTISTQVQYYASISSSVNPTYDEALSSWILQKEDLSSFINSAEWPLASISTDPNINFILYIPHPSHSPLIIPSNTHSNSFLLPQWGGVTILNLPSPATTLSKDHLKESIQTFSAQLLALLGAPPHPASLPIRLDSLTRQRCAEVIVTASSTLGSLQRLVNALPSISIPTTVSDSVKDSINHLSAACEELSKGRFTRALEMGRIAQEEAEKAFFERTMVAQVYFPDEHKLAVYMPLLGPVSVPFVLGVFRELKRWSAERKKLKAATGS